MHCIAPASFAHTRTARRSSTSWVPAVSCAVSKTWPFRWLYDKHPTRLHDWPEGAMRRTVSSGYSAGFAARCSPTLPLGNEVAMLVRGRNSISCPIFHPRKSATLPDCASLKGPTYRPIQLRPAPACESALSWAARVSPPLAAAPWQDTP